MSLDEDVRPAGVHPTRLRNPDAFLGLLRGIGLTAGDAFLVHAEFGLKLFAITLLVDYPHDRSGRAPLETAPVPPDWLAAHPDLHVPHLTEAMHTPKPTADELFDHLTDTLVLSIRERLPEG